MMLDYSVAGISASLYAIKKAFREGSSPKCYKIIVSLKL